MKEQQPPQVGGYAVGRRKGNPVWTNARGTGRLKLREKPRLRGNRKPSGTRGSGGGCSGISAPRGKCIVEGQEVDRLQGIIKDVTRWLRNAGHPQKAALVLKELGRTNEDG